MELHSYEKYKANKPYNFQDHYDIFHNIMKTDHETNISMTFYKNKWYDVYKECLKLNKNGDDQKLQQRFKNKFMLEKVIINYYKKLTRV